jgi:hypothetical protein
MFCILDGNVSYLVSMGQGNKKLKNFGPLNFEFHFKYLSLNCFLAVKCFKNFLTYSDTIIAYYDH